MQEEQMRDAAWYVDRLEQRLFNRDSEGMLVERLGPAEIRWAVDSVMSPGPHVKAAFEGIGGWLDNDIILPTGPCVPPFPPDEDSGCYSVEDMKRCARLTQGMQLRNSFGMGVFVGVVYAVIGESSCEDVLEFELPLLPVLELLGSSPLLPEDLKDSGERPWAARLEDHIFLIRTRIPLMSTLRPIVLRHGFLKNPDTVLPSRRMRFAKRSMFLAGLIAAGSEPGDLLSEVTRKSSNCRKCGSGEPKRGPRSHQGVVPDLFHKTDEELEPLLGEEAMRDHVAEELEFRLRNNRLRRMLAHLKRISRGEGEQSGDDE